MICFRFRDRLFVNLCDLQINAPIQLGVQVPLHSLNEFTENCGRQLQFGRVRYPFPKISTPGKKQWVLLNEILWTTTCPCKKVELNLGNYCDGSPFWSQLEDRNEVFPKRINLVKFSRLKLRKKVVVFLGRESAQQKGCFQLSTNPMIFHDFLVIKAGIADSNDLGYFPSVFPNKVCVALVPPSVQGRFRVPHWWCDVSTQRFQLPVHHWLIICGMELWIQMD